MRLRETLRYMVMAHTAHGAACCRMRRFRFSHRLFQRFSGLFLLWSFFFFFFFLRTPKQPSRAAHTNAPRDRQTMSTNALSTSQSLGLGLGIGLTLCVVFYC